MRTLRSFLAVTLSTAMVVEPVQALPYGTTVQSVFSISMPGSLGYVSDSYSPRPITSGMMPEMVLIQDLHVNRSVQFAISGILKRLKAQGLIPDHIAVEGATGPVEIEFMQKYPDASIRKEAADYLVREGEMPGAIHFAVSEGEGGLFGIETDQYYKANLEMFRRSYTERAALRKEVEKLQTALPKLKKDPATHANAEILEKDLAAVSQLINNQVIPNELTATLRQASEAVEHLKRILPAETANLLIEPLASSVNFYALALLRNEELFKNAMAVRELGRQSTSIVITGGFHTQSLAEECKRRGLSYVVITPIVKQNDKVDENLYVERLMDHHLSRRQIQEGLDWAEMGIPSETAPAQMIQAPIDYLTNKFSHVFDDAARMERRTQSPAGRRNALRIILGGTAATAILTAIGCGGTSTSPSAPSNPGTTPGNPAPGAGSPLPVQGTIIAQNPQQTPDSAYNDVSTSLPSGTQLRYVFSASAAGTKFLPRLLPFGANANQPTGLFKGTPFTIPPATPGVSEIAVTVTVQAADFGLTEAQLLTIVHFSIHYGSSPFGVSLGQGADKTAPYVRIERLNTVPVTPVGSTWSDEFDGPAGSAPSSSNWSYDLGDGGFGNDERERYTNSTENVFLNGQSQLVIRAKREANGEFTSGRIKTQGRFAAQYGKVEARIKLPKGQGLWPAFWMLGNDFNGSNWPQTGEIDIMEMKGQQPGVVYSALHGPGYSGSGGLASTFSGGDFSNGFHTFAADWTPDRVAFSVDGVVYHVVTRASLPSGAEWVFNKPFFIVLNMAVGGNFVGNPDSSTPFPADMVVEYVHVTPTNPATLNVQGVRPMQNINPYASKPGILPDRNRNFGGYRIGALNLLRSVQRVTAVIIAAIALNAMVAGSSIANYVRDVVLTHAPVGVQTLLHRLDPLSLSVDLQAQEPPPNTQTSNTQDGSKPVAGPAYEQTLSEHYEGPSFQGYWIDVSKEEADAILNAEYLDFIFKPLDPKDETNFRGLHIQVNRYEDYGLFAVKEKGQWKLKDQRFKDMPGLVQETPDGVVVSVPVSAFADSPRIRQFGLTQLHGQTGKQHANHGLNKKNVKSLVIVRTRGTKKTAAARPAGQPTVSERTFDGIRDAKYINVSAQGLSGDTPQEPFRYREGFDIDGFDTAYDANRIFLDLDLWHRRNGRDVQLNLHNDPKAQEFFQKFKLRSVNGAADVSYDGVRIFRLDPGPTSRRFYAKKDKGFRVMHSMVADALIIDIPGTNNAPGTRYVMRGYFNTSTNHLDFLIETHEIPLRSPRQGHLGTTPPHSLLIEKADARPADYRTEPIGHVTMGTPIEKVWADEGLDRITPIERLQRFFSFPQARPDVSESAPQSRLITTGRVIKAVELNLIFAAVVSAAEPGSPIAANELAVLSVILMAVGIMFLAGSVLPMFSSSHRPRSRNRYSRSYRHESNSSGMMLSTSLQLLGFFAFVFGLLGLAQSEAMRKAANPTTPQAQSAPAQAGQSNGIGKPIQNFDQAFQANELLKYVYLWPKTTGSKGVEEAMRDPKVKDFFSNFELSSVAGSATVYYKGLHVFTLEGYPSRDYYVKTDGGYGLSIAPINGRDDILIFDTPETRIIFEGTFNPVTTFLDFKVRTIDLAPKPERKQGADARPVRSAMPSMTLVALVAAGIALFGGTIGYTADPETAKALASSVSESHSMWLGLGAYTTMIWMFFNAGYVMLKVKLGELEDRQATANWLHAALMRVDLRIKSGFAAIFVLPVGYFIDPIIRARVDQERERLRTLAMYATNA